VSGLHLRASLTCALTTVVLTACASAENIGEEISVGEAVAGNPRGARHGAQPGEGIGLGEAVLLYAVIPLAIVLVLALLAWLPGMMRSSRYRPTRGWNAAPVWFAGPPDPSAAVEHAQVGDGRRGGASGDW
jgi:hypothetical protein